MSLQTSIILQVAEPEARLLATVDVHGLDEGDVALLKSIFGAGATGLTTDLAYTPKLLLRMGWDELLGKLPRDALYHLTQPATEYNQDVVLGAGLTEPQPLTPQYKALELYVSDVTQRFVRDACSRTRGPGFFAARTQLGPGDERFEVPQDKSVANNYAPHIARLVLFLMRLESLQKEATADGLPGGLPLLKHRLQQAVDAFVSHCSTDVPGEWVGFCSDTARPPSIEARLQTLRELQEEPVAVAALLQTIFALLYITEWQL